MDNLCDSGVKCRADNGPSEAAGFCQLCIAHFTQLQQELPHLAQALKAFKASTGGGGEKVSKTAEPGIPLSLHVMHLISQCEDAMLLVVWDDGLEVAQIHNRAEKQVGLRESWEPRLLPCPLCNEPLARKFGTERIQCRGCGFSLTEERYRGLVGVYVEFYGGVE